MRPVKFKVWDKNKKIWLTFYEEVLVNEDGKVFLVEKGCRSNSYINETTNDVVIVLFIGVIDKNNTEIYEGALIKDKYGIIYQIKWIEKHQMYAAVDKDGEMWGITDDLHEIEVVGHILEGINSSN